MTEFNTAMLQAINKEPGGDYLATLSADERQVYMAAFGAFVGCEAPMQYERKLAAASRAKRAVRWFRELKEQGKL